MNKSTCLACSVEFDSKRPSKACSRKCRDKIRGGGARCTGCSKLMGKFSGSSTEPWCKSCRSAGLSIKHGTGYAYSTGCRCAECVAGKSLLSREAAARYRAKHGVNPNTGTRRKFKDEYGFWPQAGSSEWIDPRMRLSLYERDNWTCHLCNSPVDSDAHWNENFAPSLDHLVPRSRGGTDNIDNLKTAHRVCNSARGNRGI